MGDLRPAEPHQKDERRVDREPDDYGELPARGHDVVLRCARPPDKCLGYSLARTRRREIRRRLREDVRRRREQLGARSRRVHPPGLPDKSKLLLTPVSSWASAPERYAVRRADGCRPVRGGPRGPRRRVVLDPSCRVAGRGADHRRNCDLLRGDRGRGAGLQGVRELTPAPFGQPSTSRPERIPRRR